MLLYFLFYILYVIKNNRPITADKPLNRSRLSTVLLSEMFMIKIRNLISLALLFSASFTIQNLVFMQQFFKLGKSRKQQIILNNFF